MENINVSNNINYHYLLNPPVLNTQSYSNNDKIIIVSFDNYLYKIYRKYIYKLIIIAYSICVALTLLFTDIDTIYKKCPNTNNLYLLIITVMVSNCKLISYYCNCTLMIIYMREWTNKMILLSLLWIVSDFKNHCVTDKFKNLFGIILLKFWFFYHLAEQIIYIVYYFYKYLYLICNKQYNINYEMPLYNDGSMV